MNPCPTRRLRERCRAAIAAAERYLRARQSPSSGFCFYRGEHVDEPNLADTCHALAALRRIGAAIPQAGRVEDFLRAFPTPGLDALYYHAFARVLLDDAAWLDAERVRAIRAFALPPLSAYGRAPSSGALERVRRALALKRRFATFDGVDAAGIHAAIDALRHDGGGYGAAKPNLWDTWSCLGILDRLGTSLPIEDAGRFLAALQSPQFGFVATRDSRLATVDIAHAGTYCCALLGVPVRHPEAVLDLVLACQSGDGGFARAPDALPNIELTYRALAVVTALGADGAAAERWTGEI